MSLIDKVSVDSGGLFLLFAVVVILAQYVGVCNVMNAKFGESKEADKSPPLFHTFTIYA